MLSLPEALTPKLGLDEVEGTISLNYLGLNNLIAKQDMRPGPLKGQEKLDHLHLLNTYMQCKKL